MLNPIRAAARPMIASMFLVGGMDQLNNPDPKTDAADDVAPELAEKIGLGNVETRTLVQLNGAVQVVGGLALALGKAPRLASAALAASLVPTTLAGHRFWDADDPKERKSQQIHFFKNVAMLGGLLTSVLDREGRPSLAWRSRNKADHAADLADHTRREAKLAARAAKQATRARAAEAKAEAKVRAAEARTAAKLAKRRAELEAKYQADELGNRAKLARQHAKDTVVPTVVDAGRAVASFASSDG